MENALVLIIDDEPEIVEILEAYLGREGFRTVSANDGNIGLAHYRRLRPDLVILDVKMSGLDGYEVLASIRRQAETPSHHGDSSCRRPGQIAWVKDRR